MCIKTRLIGGFAKIKDLIHNFFVLRELVPQNEEMAN